MHFGLISDPESGLSEMDFGIGRSRRDVYLQDWERYPPHPVGEMSLKTHLPDGSAAWLRIRAINRVNLTTASASTRPILIDTTPPIGGKVYDGHLSGVDLNYTSNPDKVNLYKCY